MEEYRDYIYGEIFFNEFKKVISNILLKNGFTIDEVDESFNIFIHYVEPPNDFESFLRLYVMKEELNGSIDSYVTTFSLDNLVFGKLLMDNLTSIYYELEKRCTSRYGKYKEKVIRNIK